MQNINVFCSEQWYALHDSAAVLLGGCVLVRVPMAYAELLLLKDFFGNSTDDTYFSDLDGAWSYDLR